jgi:hypothetical protein
MEAIDAPKAFNTLRPHQQGTRPWVALLALESNLTNCKSGSTYGADLLTPMAADKISNKCAI